MGIARAGSGMPIGSVMHYAANAIPPGWLKANGTAVSRATYAGLFAVIGTTYGAGDGATTFNLPELRGEFVRGLDDGRGVDAGRGIGTAQADDFKSHTHADRGGVLVGGGADVATGSLKLESAPSGATGGSETRPRNVAMLACIKFRR